MPNNESLEIGLRQYQVIGEVERRVTVRGHPGAIRLTGWFSRGNFGNLDDAVAYGVAHGTVPDAALVRRFRDRTGLGINAEQELSDRVGVFVRAGFGDGSSETDEFTDVDRTVSGGVSITGAGWGRNDDRIGVVVIANAISAARRRYLDAGGLGILVGDGRLPHYGPELIGETYYDFAVRGCTSPPMGS